MITVYDNGRVYPGTLPLQEAFAVEDGRFIFCGSHAEAAAIKADAVVDLHGAFVSAGFNDSHMHVLSCGVTQEAAPLMEHTSSLEELLRCMKDYTAVCPSYWVRGRGWNQDFFTDVHRMPDRFDLDTVSTDRPIYIIRACGHCMAVNSKALELLKIGPDTPDSEGGSIGRRNGLPDGRLYDNAMELVYRAIPVPDKTEVKAMLLRAVQLLNRYGVTSSQTDDYEVFRGLPWQTVNEAYRELEAEGKLTVRITEQANFASPEAYRDFLGSGLRTGSGDEMFRIGPLKLIGDGALGARTAYLSVPYADDPSTRGIPVFSREKLKEMIDMAVKNGMQAIVHAIGDACLDMVLDAFEEAFARYAPEDHRCGIVHCQITRPDQLRRIRKLGLIVYAQSIFLDYDLKIVEQRAGRELAASSYSWKTLLKEGVPVSNGSDCPVERPFVLGGMQCVVTRKTLAGEGPYLPEEAFSVQEALDSFTVAGAYASFEEKTKGRIAPGMLADFVLLGADPFETPAEKLKDIPVKEVYLGGRRVYDAAGTVQ